MIALIAILSLIDIACTYAGVSMGAIQEGNPIIAWGFERSIIGTCVICTMLIAVCLWVLKQYMNRFKWTRYVVAGLVGVKIIVVILHCVWIGAFFMR